MTAPESEIPSTETGPIVTEKQDARRQQIISSCSDLFFQKSFDSVSIRDIERATGLTRGAIYYYFQGKEDIYCNVVIDGLTQFYGVLKDAVTPFQGQPEEQLRAIGLAYAGYLESERPFFDNLQRFFFNRRPNVEIDPALLDKANAEARRCVDLLISVIEDGNSLGVFSCDDPEFIVMAIWGLMVTTVQMTDDNERLKSVGRPKPVLLNDLQALLLRMVGAR